MSQNSRACVGLVCINAEVRILDVLQATYEGHKIIKHQINTRPPTARPPHEQDSELEKEDLTIVNLPSLLLSLVRVEVGR